MYYTDQDWDIWEDLQDDTVRLIFTARPKLGFDTPGKPLSKQWVEANWGPLEPYPPK